MSIVLLNHQCTGGDARCHDTQLYPDTPTQAEAETQRAKSVIFKSRFLRHGGGGCLQRMRLCVRCFAFVNVQICVFF